MNIFFDYDTLLKKGNIIWGRKVIFSIYKVTKQQKIIKTAKHTKFNFTVKFITNFLFPSQQFSKHTTQIFIC